MALRPYLSISLPNKLPNILIDLLNFYVVIIAYPPRVSTGFFGILFIFYVVSFAKAIKNVQVVALFSTIAFFCKVRKKVGGARTGNGLALSGATRQLSQRERPWHGGKVYAQSAKFAVPEGFPRSGEAVTAGD